MFGLALHGESKGYLFLYYVLYIIYHTHIYIYNAFFLHIYTYIYICVCDHIFLYIYTIVLYTLMMLTSYMQYVHIHPSLAVDLL